MKKLNLQPNTPEWLEARKQYKTASEAAIVLGISPFQTPEKFKMIKLGLAKQFYSAAMRRGHDLEEQVRQWANETLGLNFKEEIWVNGEYLASLDGIDGKILVEIKVSDRTYNDVKKGALPEYYLTQMQQQMHCSPATSGYLVAYSPKADAYAISEPVYEDPSYMERISAGWLLFDQINIDEHTPVDRSDDGSVINLFGEYAGLMSKIDQLKARADKIKEKLIAEAGDRSLVAGDFKVTRSKGSTRYDYKKAAADAKVDLEPYKKEGAPTYSIKLPKNPFEVEE